jgi:hypothetical protein
VNNPYAGDSPGPGTFPVEGLAALAPDNGMPFTWNPTRERGYGVATFVPTEDGLWIGSDTDILAGEFHGRLGFLPLAGGITPPASRPARFPNDLHSIHIQNGNNNDPWLRRAYAGSGAFGAAGTVGTPWENVRGVFALNGSLYMGWSDGKIYERSFDGSSIGGATELNLYGLDSAPGGNRKIPGTNTNIPSLTTQIKNATGLAYQAGRMYYTVQGEPRLYMRYFNPQSEVIGGELFVTSTGDGVDWANVRGFTIADGQLYFAKTDNRLYRVAFANGRPSGPVTQISGSGIDQNQWQSRGMFVFKQTTDTFAPTTPGTPSGTSTRPGEVDLSWAASSDSASDTITYRVFREGVQVGEVSSDASGTIAFTDTTAPPGATVTYRIDARDAANNASALSPASSGIVVAAPDTTPPSAPGQPTGEALSRSKIRVTWAASTDDSPTELTYRVYRDGEQVGQVVSSSGTTVTFDDTGLAPSTAYVYTVDAVDAEDNVSDPSSPSDPVLTLGVIFADDFSSGDLTSWHEVDDMTIDGSRGSPAAPSVRAETSLNGAVLRRDLDAALPAACVSTRVSVEARQGSGGVDVALDLFRLRTTGGGPLMRVLADSSGDLGLRNDTASSGATLSSGVPLPSGWNEVELCGTSGVGGSWTLFLNGSTVIDAWVTDTPDTGIARLQLGDPGQKTITANWDDVVIDTAPG